MSNKPRPDFKSQRIQEGEARNEAWRKLTTAQKLASLRKRPGQSKRQVSKLQAAGK